MTGKGFPGSSIPIIDTTTGRATNAFWLLLESIWERAGGFDDIPSELAAADAGLLALINSIEESQLLQGDSLERSHHQASDDDITVWREIEALYARVDAISAIQSADELTCRSEIPAIQYVDELQKGTAMMHRAAELAWFL